MLLGHMYMTMQPCFLHIAPPFAKRTMCCAGATGSRRGGRCHTAGHVQFTNAFMDAVSCQGVLARDAEPEGQACPETLLAF